MRSLHFSLLCLLLAGCASDYRHLKTAEPDDPCELRLIPNLTSPSWFDASIDVAGQHISGLLLIKTMADSSRRVVFTNEAGITYLDFGFLRDGTFKVFNVIHQLNRKAVITTLRKDFELIIGLPFHKGKFLRFVAGEEVYFGVKQKKETAYFITSKDCASLQRMERGSARKRVVSVSVQPPGYPTPERLELTHHTFNMQIKLTRIQKE